MKVLKIFELPLVLVLVVARQPGIGDDGISVFSLRIGGPDNLVVRQRRGGQGSLSGLCGGRNITSRLILQDRHWHLLAMGISVFDVADRVWSRLNASRHSFIAF